MSGDVFGLEDTVAIVTGGAGKLGGQYARALASHGEKVAIFDIAERTRPDLCAYLDSEKNVSYLRVDITNKYQVATGFRAVISSWGRAPSILINNAGIDIPPGSLKAATGAFEHYPEEVFAEVLDSHVLGSFLMSQEFVRNARAARIPGSIINIASIYGVVSPDQSIYESLRQDGKEFYKPVSYSVAKAGMIGFTRWLAGYCGSFSIRVNAVVLGGVEAGQDSSFKREYSKRTMLGRMAGVHEYNGIILFLASPALSSYVTGSIIHVDGGYTAY